MWSLKITALLKFFVGILLVQAATALLTYVAVTGGKLAETGWLFASVAGLLGVLVALWFGSLLDQAAKQSTHKIKERHAREREKLKVQAEKQRNREARTQERRLADARKKADRSGGMRTGIVISGAVGLGAVLVLAQFMTLGLLTLTTAGGAALGYGVRMRQEKLGRAKLLASEPADSNIKIIETTDEPKRLPRWRKRLSQDTQST